ncbi:MAG: beta-N-acetylhexosaminidase [Rhizobiales bacterium]|nr:beta-N-acetylhexosaminidase [Hyphomicrobiales bacterium]MBO6698404.1 beta-N-acetylhexosaminidase [Hyphomicrobiales bacterium]MBO6735342.1 beta-N-acetylhexosaminidase [Hyphomicrobiales bacterium]MBO6910850.1 beta-N-acetylhexosaminidase [Hyphomicrobiales bacterium]MBO6955906.1 beta-N-acetylhexosaminidase [Hyphomicrobiales bacterium]
MPNAGSPSSGTRAFICGLEGLEVTDFERAYLRETKPWGVILFGRNIDNPDQVRRLTSDVREALDWQAPILIDQEGGRVQRLKPPHWRRYPAANRFGAIEMAETGAGVEAAQIATWMIADDLLQVGINVNCTPVLDLSVSGGTDAIGNRAFHCDPKAISLLGRTTMDAYLQAGVAPVIKHMPGHGRAVVDSHFSLPRITNDRETLEATDFAPFKALKDAPLAMTGHLVFEAIDPDLPVTLSPTMVALIRDSIGFDGALMTDDLAMGALSGSMAERASGALAAGCDLALHCNGNRAEMEVIREAIPPLEGRSAERCAAALARLGRQSVDRATLTDRLDALLAIIGAEEVGPDPTAFVRNA